MIENDFDYKNFEKLIPQLLKVDLYKDKKFECCPHCQGKYFTKNGKYKGVQRYICKKCKKTFSNTTNSLWYYSKKDSNIWFKYIELFLQRKTLRECASELNMNLSTAFFWRHKILNILKSANFYGINPDKFVGDVSAETICFQEETYDSTINFKADYYNQQKHIIAVAVCDSHDSMLITPISRFRFDSMNFRNKVVNKRLDPKALIMTNSKDGFLINSIVVHNNKISNIWKSKPRFVDEKLDHIGVKISDWFCKFLGVAAKYLESYLSYYILFNLNRCFKSIDMSYSLVKYFGFIKTNRIKELKLVL